MSLDNKKAKDAPEIASALIAAITPLQSYLIGPKYSVSNFKMWNAYNIGELKKLLRELTETIEGVL